MNRININKVRVLPEYMDFGFCVYGEPSREVSKWAKSWGFRLEKIGPYTNILVPFNFDISECFEKFSQYKYVDGYSHDLSRNLHIGDLSKFIVAKALQSMDVGDKTVSLLRDGVSNAEDEALSDYNEICNMFEFHSDDVYSTSKLKADESILNPGEGDYIGTKIFKSGDVRVVGVKSDDTRSGFYDDMAFAKMLDEPTLYIESYDHENYFKNLKVFYPKVNLVNLGMTHVHSRKLIRVKQIPLVGIIEGLKEAGLGSSELIYNILAGMVLKTAPKIDNNFCGDIVDNPKNSPGLYLSYTLARLKSAGVESEEIEMFNNTSLQFVYMKALFNLRPDMLLKTLVQHCQFINSMYVTHKIEGSLENGVMFSNFKEDLELGMKKLGMFLVDKT